MYGNIKAELFPDFIRQAQRSLSCRVNYIHLDIYTEYILSIKFLINSNDIFSSLKLIILLQHVRKQ